MKKIVTIAAIALVGTIVLPSCKKDFTCTCTYKDNGKTESVDLPMNNVTKKDAKAACDAADATYAAYIGTECKLK